MMSRLHALRPYSMFLLIPLWMIGGAATTMGHRIAGVATMTVMLVLVLDSAMVGSRKGWPFRRSIAVGSAMTASAVGALTLTGYMPL